MQTRNGLGIKVASMYAKQELNTHTRVRVCEVKTNSPTPSIEPDYTVWQKKYLYKIGAYVTLQKKHLRHITLKSQKS